MSWKLIGSPKTQKATRKLAEEFVTMEMAPRDRPLSERRLQVYQQILNKGEFRPVTWASANCLETGATYRVNGKHTSILLSKAEPLPELYVTVEKYECDTLEDVARLYSTFDSKMQSRTANDIYRSFASCIPELVEVPAKVINLTICGVAYFTYQDAYGAKQTAQERAENIFEHSDFAMWVPRVIPSTAEKNRHLYRLAVFAAMFATYTKSKSAASDFWKAVCEESGSQANLPDRKLARYLLTHFSSKGGNQVNSKAGRYRVADREIYVKCLHAWNAWRKTETTNLNYYPEAEIPSIR